MILGNIIWYFPNFDKKKTKLEIKKKFTFNKKKLNK